MIFDFLISEKVMKQLTIFVIVMTHHVLCDKSPRSPLADPELFCDGCHALVTELAQDMAASSGQGLGLAARIGAIRIGALRIGTPRRQNRRKKWEVQKVLEKVQLQQR